MTVCLLFHKWGKWETYRWSGVEVPQFGKNAGKKFEVSETRQRRSCSKCGFVQDRLVSDG